MINNKRQVFTLRTLQLNRKHRLKKKIKKRISLKSDNISSIEPIYKFLDPYYCHRFLSDLIIIDKLYQNDNFYISIYEKLATTKHILSVDRTENYLFVNFLETDNIDKSPLGFISERLKSLGSLEAFKLAKTLELYSERIDLIIQTRIFGQMIEFLNNLNNENLEYIRDYFKMIENAEIPNNNWKIFFDEKLQKNSKNLCFFLKFNKLKPNKGIELLAMGMNWELHKLLEFDELDILRARLFLIEVSTYFEKMNEIISEMFSTNQFFKLDLHLKTKVGLLKLSFLAEKHFFYDNGHELKVIILFSCNWEDLSFEVKEFLRNHLNPHEKIYSFKAKGNEIWEKSVGMYFKRVGNKKK